VRLYDRLFDVPSPDDDDFLAHLNPRSLELVEGAKLEPSLAAAVPGARVQFERHGYFCVDTVDSTPGRPVFNRTVALRDSWAKVAAGDA
jgi:glutaminyl-tRNA synthetase